MGKSLKLLVALTMAVAPGAVQAMPLGNIGSVQIAPAETLVQNVEVRRHPVHHGPVHHGPVNHGPVHHGPVNHGPVHRGPVVHHGPDIHRNTVVVRRPYRPWVRRPYYGTVVAGVALGTVIAVAAATPPAPPSSNVCWYWSNSAQTNGYWDYCH